MLKTLKFNLEADFDIADITDQVNSFIKESAIEEGSVLIFSKGSTGTVTTLEYKEGMLQDLKNALEKVAPKDGKYEHFKDWGDDNGFSHVRSALMKPSIVVPFKDRTLQLGTWQQIVVINFDTRKREREVLLRILK